MSRKNDDSPVKLDVIEAKWKIDYAYAHITYYVYGTHSHIFHEARELQSH